MKITIRFSILSILLVLLFGVVLTVISMRCQTLQIVLMLRVPVQVH